MIYIHDIFEGHRIADRVVIMENGEKVADVNKDDMTAEELEHIMRDGRRQVGEAAARGEQHREPFAELCHQPRGGAQEEF